ncbi:MAG TPA: hypothetical protein VGW34_01140 [Allosphingosinicella sp.]|nr:hypothetical protein [Allosphingosinicella sp.]
MAAGLAVGTIIQNLIASGPIWSALVPVVSALSRGAIDTFSGWQRARARKRYETTFKLLGPVEQDLLERIKDSWALIDCCDEIIARVDTRKARGWTWAFTLGFMVLTGISTQPGDPLAGDNDLGLPQADMLDPIVAATGGAVSAWLGNAFAWLTGRRPVAAVPGGIRVQDALVDYSGVRDSAIQSLVGALSREIVETARIPREEIDEMRAREARSGLKKTRDALTAPFRAMVRWAGY